MLRLVSSQILKMFFTTVVVLGAVSLEMTQCMISLGSVCSTDENGCSKNAIQQLKFFSNEP